MNQPPQRLSAKPQIPYEILFDNLLEGAILIDLGTGEVTRCNKAFSELVGLEGDIISTGHLLSLLPSDQSDGTHSAAALKKIIDGAISGDRGPFELEHIHSSGQVLSLQLTVIAIPDHNGQCFIVYRDLTKLKDAKEDSDLHQQRFETIFQQAPISIAIATAEDEILSINPQFTRFLGYSQDEVLGRKFSEITHPDDQQLSEELHRKMVTSKGERFKMAKRYLRKDGSYVWGQSVASAMYDEEGKPSVVLSMQQDIDELKRAQAELSEKEIFLRSVTENLNEAVLVVSKDGKLRYANAACKEFIGLDSVSTSVEQWGDQFGVYEPDEQTKLDAENRPLIMALNGQTVFSTPLFIKITALGIGRHVLMDAIPLRNTSGEIDQAMGVFRDVSDMRIAEQLLEEGAERESALVASVPDMILRLDKDGRCLYYKEDCPVLLSFDPKAFLGKTMKEFFSPERYALHFPFVEQAISTGQIQQYEYDNVVDGEVRYFEARVVKASDNEVVVFIRDFTDRRSDQLELLNKQNSLEALINAWPDLLFRFSADGVFLDSKAERAEELIVAPEEFLGKKFEEVLDRDLADFFQFQIKKSKNSDEVHVFEYQVPLPDRTLDYEGRIVHGENDEIVFFGRNITERKKKDQELLEVNRQLEIQAAELLELNKDLEHYAYYAAHDIRGPMNNINALLKMISEQDGVKEESKLLFEKAEQAVGEMRRIVDALNDVLGLKKSLHVQSGGSSVSETLERVLIGLNELIDGNNVSVVKSLSGSERSIVASVHLYSVLQNLVINAIRYQRAGVRNKINISSADVGGMLELRIKDNGMGIDMEANSGKIFRMFKRFHDHVPGRGIGLYMVKSIVESYGGTIEVESEVNIGTEFIIRLPLK